jgi:hypothetical protein
VSVRTTTDIHPRTITEVSMGAGGALGSPRTRRRRDGVWNSPLARSQVDDRVLQAAIETAGGDPNRLWFDRTDGSVWILNHSRMTTCVSPACPPCSAK